MTSFERCSETISFRVAREIPFPRKNTRLETFLFNLEELSRAGGHSRTAIHFCSTGYTGEYPVVFAIGDCPAIACVKFSNGNVSK